jgi:DNA repair ATPase RecN
MTNSQVFCTTHINQWLAHAKPRFCQVKAWKIGLCWTKVTTVDAQARHEGIRPLIDDGAGRSVQAVMRFAPAARGNLGVYFFWRLRKSD